MERKGTSFKRHRVAEWMKNQNHLYAAYQKFTSDRHSLQNVSERVENHSPYTWKQKKKKKKVRSIASIATLSDKIDFKIDCSKRHGRALHNDQGIESRKKELAKKLKAVF